MYPSLTLSKGFSTKGIFRNIGIDMKKMNKQSAKGNSNEEKMTELYCRHLFHPRVPASSKFLPGMVANLNSSLSSCVKIREGCGKSKWKFLMAFAIGGGGLEGVSFAIKLF